MLTAVTPIGLRDREAGTVGFTTSLGFGRKLDGSSGTGGSRSAYLAREHGFATAPRFVLVQGMASYTAHPDHAVLDERVRPASVRFLGPPRTGARWLKAYYSDRILVTVAVERRASDYSNGADPPNKPGHAVGRTGAARANRRVRTRSPG